MINKLFGLPPIDQPPMLKSIVLSNNLYFQFYLFPIVFFYIFFNHHCYHCYTSGLSWSLKISKNNYDCSPNDRFLIKIFLKIISLDSSQRVPPMSPCPPVIVTRVCPWLINHLSDPWNFNKSNGILLRSNWRKPYPKFYGSELLIIQGWSRQLTRRYHPYLLWGGLLIRCWHYLQWIQSSPISPPHGHPAARYATKLDLSHKIWRKKNKKICWVFYISNHLSNLGSEIPEFATRCDDNLVAWPGCGRFRSVPVGSGHLSCRFTLWS